MCADRRRHEPLVFGYDCPDEIGGSQFGSRHHRTVLFREALILCFEQFITLDRVGVSAHNHRAQHSKFVSENRGVCVHLFCAVYVAYKIGVRRPSPILIWAKKAGYHLRVERTLRGRCPQFE